MTDPILVANNVSLTGPSNVVLNVDWPGGRGQLAIDSMTVSGAAKLHAQSVGVYYHDSIVGLLSMQGQFPDATGPGVQTFDLPRALLELKFSVPSGESLSAQGVWLIPLES